MHRLLSLFVLAASLAVAGCDQTGPTSAEDFDVQPLVSVSTSGLTFTAGQDPPATFTVRYQGLDAAPEPVAAAGVDFELIAETGSAQSGTRTFAVRFSGDVPTAGSVDAVATVRATSGGREITQNITLRVNSPLSITNDFQSRLAVVEDYEGDGQSFTATGGATAEVVTEGVSPNSSGFRALKVTGGGPGSGVTLNRTVNAPGQGVFSFLVRPETADDFTLTVTFRDRAGADTRQFDVDVPVTGGGDWRRVSIAATQLFADFNPVAVRSGGDGPLTGVTFTASTAATYLLDDVAFGTGDGPSVEVNDFERTSFFYIGATTFEDIDVSNALGDGAQARRFTYTNGGNFFGYNYQNDGPALFLNAGSNGALSIVVGQVTKAFDLYVFIETAGNAYSYGSGVVVPIEASDAFRTVRVPLANLGGSVDALGNPGITNVGFEVRRRAADTTTDPISFVFDDVKLIGRN